MARRLWGCYSVADHLRPRAFVADVLLYDRLLIPTPASDDLGRWERKWDPQRQERLLDILGPFAERIEWNARLRDQWKNEWSKGDLAQDADSAYEWTRKVIAGTQLEAEVKESGDVRAFAVYATEDEFEREWRLVRSPLFVRRETAVRSGKLTQAIEAAPAEQERLAKLVVTALLVPNDGVNDEETLKRTVDLVTKPGVSECRAALHEAIAAVKVNDRIRDATVVTEIDELVKALNEAVRRNTKRRVARVCVTGMTWGLGGFALWFATAGAAAGPLTTLGDALVTRAFGKEEPDGDDGIKLLAEAKKALAK
jgi:hypothetical protein